MINTKDLALARISLALSSLAREVDPEVWEGNNFFIYFPNQLNQISSLRGAYVRGVR